MRVLTISWDLNGVSRCLLAIAFAHLAFASIARAQDLDTLALTGRITDQNGAVIPGATVTARLTNTGVSRTINSDDQGRYRLIQLEPGGYTLQISANGFATQRRTDLTAVAGQNVQIDFALLPQSIVADTLVVTAADAPLVDTTRTVVGGTVVTHELETLPVF